MEIGAQWIHGSNNSNVAYQLANDAGLVDNSQSEEKFSEQLLFENSGPLDDDVEDQLLNISGKIDTLAKGFPGAPGLSYGAFMDQQYPGLTQNIPSIAQYAASFKDLLHRSKREDDGSPTWYDLSFNGSQWQFTETGGSKVVRFKKDHKYEDLVNLVKAKIPSRQIVLDTSVAKIRYADPKAQLQVITDQGITYLADFVIVTVSLGVLKAKGQTLFDPALPANKWQAISQVGFGIVDKIYLEFPKAIFTANEVDFMFNDPGIAYSAQDAAKDWTRFIYDAYADENLNNTVSLWISGEGAKYMETLTPQQVQDGCMQVLRRFLPGQSLPDPINILVSHWSQDPYTFGSFSYQSVASELAKVGPETLAEPVGNGRVLFAGEATSETHFSTVHGAIEAGYREAMNIVQG